MRTKLTIYKSILATAISILMFSSCDNNFEEMNTNPDASPIIKPEYMFTKAQLDAFNSYYSTGVVSAGGSIQHFATYKDVPGLGDKYYFQQGTYPYDYFLNTFPTAVNEIGEVIRAVSENSNSINLLATSRIWRVYINHRLTDLYGDIPYSEAALGYTENNFTPKYDEQSFIYSDMLKELEEAIASFDATKPDFGQADLIYNGSIEKWKKFGYSLMLRLAMRLTKVDEGMAKTWAQKAIAGGVITLDADIARIKYLSTGLDLNKNPYALQMRNNDYGVANGDGNTEGGKLAKTFIDYLKTTHDPRLNVIAVVWNGVVADTTTSLQKGMPNGILGKPSDFKSLSEPNPNTVLRLDAPVIVISAAEVNLLLTEAFVRGWYNEDPSVLYSNGVGAAMRNWALFSSNGVIATEKINNYISNNPFKAVATFEEQLEQIHSQMWVTLYPDEQEAFANWRRTGYPVLTPVSVVGNITNGSIPRRLLYPPSEESVNGEELSKAIVNQGANLLTTKIWWDN